MHAPSPVVLPQHLKRIMLAVLKVASPLLDVGTGAVRPDDEFEAAQVDITLVSSLIDLTLQVRFLGHCRVDLVH